MDERVRVVVAHLDSPGKDGNQIDSRSVVCPMETVPLTVAFDGDRVVGMASLALDGRCVVADIRSTVPLTGLYPAIGFLSRLPPSRHGQVQVHYQAEIFAVSVSKQPNADPTIEPIK